MRSALTHKTVVIKKTYSSPIGKVFKAFSSVTERSKWSVPKGDALKYIRAEFKIGGTDVFKCGSPGALDIKGIVKYINIIKDKLIISSESLSHKKTDLSAALVTIELIEVGTKTSVAITAQITSLNGADMSKGYKQGWKATLNNLAEHLSKTK